MITSNSTYISDNILDLIVLGTFEGVSKLMIAIKDIARKAFSYLVELGAVVVAAIFYPLGALAHNPKTLPPACQKVTILVHGFLHNSEAWFYLKSRMKKYPELNPVFTINLGHPFQSIDDYTKKLDLQVKAIQAMNHGQDLEVNFVAHSMGGLVCSNYAANLSKEADVNLPKVTIKKIITIASPINGSPVAKYGKFFACAKDMIPSSPFLKNLHEKVSTIVGTTFYHIGCEFDFIAPKENTFFGNQNHKEFKNIGHVACLLSPQVIDYVIESLLE